MLYNKISLCILAISTLTFTDAAATRRSDSISACRPLDGRAEKIRESFYYAYSGYKKFAFGHDELLPVTNGFSDTRY